MHAGEAGIYVRLGGVCAAAGCGAYGRGRDRVVAGPVYCEAAARVSGGAREDGRAGRSAGRSDLSADSDAVDGRADWACAGTVGNAEDLCVDRRSAARDATVGGDLYGSTRQAVGGDRACAD